VLVVLASSKASPLLVFTAVSWLLVWFLFVIAGVPVYLTANDNGWLV